MEPTSTFRWRITMILMINTMLMLLVHVVQPMPLHYNPRLRPYLTKPPLPPAVPASPPPPPPLPSLEDLVCDLNKLVCDHSCSLECCHRFGDNETLSECGGLHGPSHPIPEFVARLLFPYSFCYSKCHKRCSHQLPPNLYQCTAGCAYHYIGTNSTEVTDSDAEKEKMRKHVASCYHECKKFSKVV